MILEYAGVDLSAFTTKYGVSEASRIIEGPTAGVSISGKDIPDVVAVKFDPTFVLRPLIPSQITTVWTLVRAMPTYTYRTLKYTSPEGITRTITAKLEAVEAVKCLENTSRTMYNGIVLTFREQ